MTRIYDLSQPLNQDIPPEPFYPPFEVKYIKRKAEHGVNVQYIMTSNHMGTHLDAPRHAVTAGKTIDQLPLEWLYGTGVIVDLSDMLDELDIFRPEDIEARAEVQEGDILFIHTGWHRHSQFGAEPDEEKYIQRHPGPHHSLVDWLLEKKIRLWGVDMVSTDHPMNLSIGRSLERGGTEEWQRVRAQAEEKFGADKLDELFPEEAYRLTHNGLFPYDCFHIENLGGQISDPTLHNRRITLGGFPWLFKGGEAAFCRAVAFVED
jgi:arylformamidase